MAKKPTAKAAPPRSSENAFEVLDRAVDELLSQEIMVEQLEADLEAAKKRLRVLQFERLPDLMDQTNTESLERNGYKVSVGEIIEGGLPKDPERREEALNYLETHDGGGLIKTELSISFGKDELERARKIAAELRRMHNDLTPEVDRSVHAQSLKAWAREVREAGKDLPAEKLGLYIARGVRAKKLSEKKKSR